MGVPGLRGATGQQGPPVCCASILSFKQSKKITFIWLISYLPYMVFLSWLLLKGEPGNQGGQGLKGERGAEVSQTCWLWKVGTPENAVYYPANRQLRS